MIKISESVRQILENIAIYSKQLNTPPLEQLTIKLDSHHLVQVAVLEEKISAYVQEI